MVREVHILFHQDQIKMNRTTLLLSTQRALLGMITPKMRAVTIGYSEIEFILRVYFDSDYSEDDVELLSEITTQIVADNSEIKSVKEELLVSTIPLRELEGLDSWVFERRE